MLLIDFLIIYLSNNIVVAVIYSCKNNYDCYDVMNDLKQRPEEIISR